MAAFLPTSSDQADVSQFSCPSCGYPYRLGELVCSNCNLRFSHAADTHQIDSRDLLPVQPPPPRGDAYVTSPKPIVLQIDGQRVTLPADFSELVIGRHSPIAGDIQPDIDLTQFGAGDKGVSRRHITLKRKNYLTYLVDLGSSNGTWLNGKRVAGPGERLLRNGDELQLGKLKINVRF